MTFDIKYVMELINNGLFPIACCGGLVFIIYVMFKAYREDMQKLQAQHETETKDFTKALNNNTNALNKLSDRLGRYTDDKE